jgi:RNAse (barnase) inhibitor barstar
MDRKTIIIDGNNISNLKTFYEEIDRILTKDLDWKTGHNLDAFNDILRGGFGVAEYKEPIILIWKNASKNKNDLGIKATKRFYKIKICMNKYSLSNVQNWKGKLKQLFHKNGKTLFTIIVDIIKEHEHIEFKFEN